MATVSKVTDGRAGAIAALDAEGLKVTEWHDDPGAAYEEHEHPFAETRVVLGGTMAFVVGGHKHVLGPGDRIDLAPGEPHTARVGPDGVHYLAATRRSGGRQRSPHRAEDEAERGVQGGSTPLHGVRTPWSDK